MVSPYLTNASEFNADRPVIIGEVDPNNTGPGGPTPDMTSQAILDNGYQGSWPWSLTTGDVPAITSAIAQAAPTAGTIDRAAVEACIQDKPESCYISWD